MGIALRNLVAPFVFLVGLGLMSPAPAFGNDGSENIARQVQQLENHALSRGVLIEDIRVSRHVGAGEAGTASSSCTATATVSIPGGAGVELSATAPTCSEAIQMLTDAIPEFLEP